MKRKPRPLVKFRIRETGEEKIGQRRTIAGTEYFSWTWFGPMRKRTLGVATSDCDIIEDPWKGRPCDLLKECFAQY